MQWWCCCAAPLSGAGGVPCSKSAAVHGAAVNAAGGVVCSWKGSLSGVSMLGGMPVSDVAGQEVTWSESYGGQETRTSWQPKPTSLPAGSLTWHCLGALSRAGPPGQLTAPWGMARQLPSCGWWHQGLPVLCQMLRRACGSREVVRTTSNHAGVLPSDSYVWRCATHVSGCNLGQTLSSSYANDWCASAPVARCA
jgi:hypothetical protein